MHPLIEKFLEQPIVYGTWQKPCADAKIRPVLENNDLKKVRRVLDVGCGPGTNTGYFLHTNYLGVDINPDYIEVARRKHRKEFMVADVTKMTLETTEAFDFILVNSFFHHIPDEAVLRILRSIAGLLSEDGAIHVLDLTLPEEPSVARWMAKMDRGNYPRPLNTLRSLIADVFEIEIEQPYPVHLAGMICWRMIYFKGRKRTPGEIKP